ncbi:MAG: hypothetical protein HQK59_15340 [Deltaproteobacteria bacterium]|nr:hypothetical protein [Deltaproteobacteria bacterium]
MCKSAHTELTVHSPECLSLDLIKLRGVDGTTGIRQIYKAEDGRNQAGEFIIIDY